MGRRRIVAASDRSAERRLPMSVQDVSFDRGVTWPSNGISEVPFRLYTDPEQYRLEQERHLQGPDLELPVPRRRNCQSRRLGRDDARRGRGHRRARRGRRGQRFRQPLRPSRQPLVPRAPGPQQGNHLHLSRLELRPRRPADRRRLREGGQAPGRHGARIPQGRPPTAAAAGRRIVRSGVRHVRRARRRTSKPISARW